MCAMTRQTLGNLWMAILFLACTVPLSCAAPCPGAQSRDEKVLLQQEEKWAKALDHNDVQAVGCLLADEFQDADVATCACRASGRDGSVFRRRGRGRGRPGDARDPPSRLVLT